MITKFISRGEEMCEIEFLRTGETLTIEIEHKNPYTTQERHEVELSSKDLFDLIGQLLRIQSEFKKEAEND